MRRLLFALIVGAGGCAVLIALGLWQVQRLAWKEALLAEIGARIAAPAEPLPPEGAAEADLRALRFQPVELEGRTTGAEVLVLTGQKGVGAGYEIIAAFETAEGRRILLDRGFVPEGREGGARPPVALRVRGNLHWPEETDRFTPPPDRGRNLWFARDVPSMAEALGTEPILVVVREAEGDAQGVEPVPVSTAGIPNDHREYAITWFSLAAVWAGMTGFFVWRIRRRGI